MGAVYIFRHLTYWSTNHGLLLTVVELPYSSFQHNLFRYHRGFLESVKRGGDLAKKVNILSGIPLLGMLEGSVSCPGVFQFLTQSLVKVLDVVEDFLLKAADHGLLMTFVNGVRALCIWSINNR